MEPWNDARHQNEETVKTESKIKIQRGVRDFFFLTSKGRREILVGSILFKEALTENEVPKMGVIQQEKSQHKEATQAT